MANLLLIFALILVLILTFFETVTVRFTHARESVISIDFLLFKLILYPSRKKKDKKKKSRPLTKFRARFERARVIRDTVAYVLSHSDVIIHELNIKEHDDDPAKRVFKSSVESSLLATLLAYLSLEIQSLKIEDDIFELPHKIDLLPAPVIDVTFKGPLYNAITAYLIYSRKMKKARKHAYATVGK